MHSSQPHGTLVEVSESIMVGILDPESLQEEEEGQLLPKEQSTVIREIGLSLFRAPCWGQVKEASWMVVAGIRFADVLIIIQNSPL